MHDSPQKISEKEIILTRADSGKGYRKMEELEQGRVKEKPNMKLRKEYLDNLMIKNQ